MEININKYQKDPKNNTRREIIITYFDTDTEIPTAIQVYDKDKHTFVSKSFKSLGIDNQDDIKENKSLRTEYALNVKNKQTDEFLYQIECYETYQEALEEILKSPLEDPNDEYYIQEIHYNEHEEETDAIPIYYHEIQEDLKDIRKD